MRKYLAVMIGLVHLSSGVSAQNDTISLSAVEVVASPMSRNVSAVGEVQSLRREELKTLGIDNVADAVKRFAGVSVKDYGGIGGMKTVSIHNLGAHHTEVSYDGVTVSNTQAGQIDVGRYDTDNLETVALYVGDEDNLMLSARQYASAGVLAMQTERPRFDSGRRQSWRFRMLGGSFGLASPSMRWAALLGRNTVVSAYGKMTRADGNYPYILKNGQVRTHEHRSNTDIVAWNAEANLYHSFADGGRLDVKTSWYSSRRGLPGAVILYAHASEERMWDEDFLLQTLYNRRLSAASQLSLRAKYTRSWNRYQDRGSQYPEGIRTDVDRQHEYYLSATWGWNVLEGLDFALAEDVSYNDLDNNVYINMNYDVPHPSRLTSVTAMVLKWRHGRMKVNGSMAYTYAAERVSVGEAPADKRRLAPSVAVNYRLLPDHQLYVRAQWKHSFRVPTFNDLYYRRLGNINLRPELAREYSMGLAWNVRPPFMRYVALTIDGYYNDVKDKIVAFPSTYVWRMVNYGKVEIMGMDMTLGAQADIRSGWNVKGTASATWQRAVDKTNKASQTYGNQLPYTPQWSGSGSVVLTTPWCEVGYTVVMQGSRYSMEQNKPEYKMAAFADHCLTVNRDLRWKKCKMHLQLKVANLTNAQYEIIQYYPMPGRQLSATVAIEL